MTKTIEQSFADWESSVFGFGYGTGEHHVIPALKKFFAAIGEEDSSRRYDYRKLEEAVTPTVAWLLINVLCRYKVDMFEYGTSPRFGWLTEQGENMQAFLASKTEEELLNIDSDDSGCCPDICNCGPDGYQEGIHCHNPFWIKPR